MRKILNKLIDPLDAILVRKSSYEKLVSQKDKFRIYEFSELIDQDCIGEYFGNLTNSKSQLGQDLFALSELGFKRNGFFVEFGATNGIDFSNTYLMETKFDWKGILAEPAKLWHSSLNKNRSASIELDCVWKATGETLLFNEVNDGDVAELSTINNFSNSDNHRETRKALSNKYEVNTISLNDMLKKYNAPKNIDYLSIDTEGSEYEILKTFDFDKYKVKVITCEHNYTPTRNKIYSLLSANGYQRKFTEFSLWDDWYIRN